MKLTEISKLTEKYPFLRISDFRGVHHSEWLEVTLRRVVEYLPMYPRLQLQVFAHRCILRADEHDSGWQVRWYAVRDCDACHESTEAPYLYHPHYVSSTMRKVVVPEGWSMGSMIHVPESGLFDILYPYPSSYDLQKTASVGETLKLHWFDSCLHYWSVLMRSRLEVEVDSEFFGESVHCYVPPGIPEKYVQPMLGFSQQILGWRRTPICSNRHSYE